MKSQEPTTEARRHGDRLESRDSIFPRSPDHPITRSPDSSNRRRPRLRSSSGMTMIELIAAITILSLLTGMAIPLAKLGIQRDRERRLRRDLWEMRDAIDHYKDAADRGAFQIKLGSEGYPPDLETLVQGVDSGGKKIRFLRKIPADPFTGKAEWGLRSMQDDADSDSWGGQNVFDVFTKSDGTALNGTKYKDW